CFAGALNAAEAEQDYLSPIALAADKESKTLYVAELTAKQVACFDIASGQVAKRISLADPASGLALAPDGLKLYVTGAAPDGRVHIIDLSAGKVTESIAVGHTPVAPVVSADGATLLVCNRFNSDVSVIDLAARKEVARVPASREPVAAVLTPDGKYLLVANQLPTGPADGNYVAAVVSIVDVAARKPAGSLRLPNGSNGLRAIALSPDGRHAYVSHILARYQVPTTQIERGWIATDALSVIDVASRSLLNTVLLDDVDLGAANPWGVACTADGRYLCVAHAGTHEISVIDRIKLHEKLARVAGGEKVSDVSATPGDVPNDLSFLVGLRRRLSVAGNGPRALAIIGSKAYVTEYFTDSLGVVNISADAAPAPTSLALGPRKPLSRVRRGEMLFHDAQHCFQKWVSCSSCHPDESRPDGLNWDLLNDGIGNPKNTKSLVLAHETPPTTVTGARANAEASVRAGFRFIEFAVRPEEDAAAVDAYLKSLRPVPSPYLVNGRLSASAQRGQEVFQSAGCADCHPPPYYTNMKKCDVGTGKGREKGAVLDPQTLLEVWRTAPYLHDGRAATIKDVLTRFNMRNHHGNTLGLEAGQINDLVEYVLSL
ncbi:MAG: cell surface protein, partial [Chloroflexi bacterium]|nr:cell surface protein [Chloroflexota bacterium]